MSLADVPISLRQLQYAVAVADLQSFRRAAERCHVSQPSLSAQIAQLERSLGLRLFDRDRRRVAATAAGQPILDRARQVLVEAADLVEEARRAGNPLTGTLRIGVIPTVSPYLLPGAARALRARYPQLTVRWIEDKTAALAGALAAGALDAAVVSLEAKLGAVEHAVIARDAFVLAAPARHALAAPAGPVRLADLRGAPILLLDEGHCLREQALAVCGMARAEELGFRATSLPTLAQMVAGGAGVTLLPEIAVGLEGRRAGLRLRRFADPAPYRTIGLAWRRRSAVASAMPAIAEVIRQAYPVARRAAGVGNPAARGRHRAGGRRGEPL